MSDIDLIKKLRKKNWHAIYTKPRWEKRLLKEYCSMGIEAYLPMVIKTQQWSDRKKKVQMPLIPSYIFVKTDYRGFYEAVKTLGAVSGIMYNKYPAIIDESQIKSLKIILDNIDVNNDINMERYIPGVKVKVVQGQFEGSEGELVYIKNKNYLHINLDLLNMNVSVDIDAECVEVFEEVCIAV